MDGILRLPPKNSKRGGGRRMKMRRKRRKRKRKKLRRLKGRKRKRKQRKKRKRKREEIQERKEIQEIEIERRTGNQEDLGTMGDKEDSTGGVIATT